MYKIPSIVYNATLRTYKPRGKDTAAVIGKRILDWQDGGKELRHAKLISNLSVRGFMQKQEEYRHQIIKYETSSKVLGEAADVLTNPSFFEEKKIDVSEPDVFKKTNVNSSANVAEYVVAVTQMASNQTNESKRFPKNSRDISNGIYTLGIKLYNKQEKQATIYISANDNMHKVTQKFAGAINAAGMGVIAQVKEKEEQIYLYLQAQESGANNSFTIRDINGGAVGRMDLNHIVQPAANTGYIVNGEKQESSNNEIQIDGGNLLLVADSETKGVKINITRSHIKFITAVRDVLTQYNNLQDILSFGGKLSGEGEKLLAGLTTLIGKTQKEEFQSIGINMDESSNRLNFDEDKLLESITDNPKKAKQLFSEEHGLGAFSKSLAKNIQENPLNSFVKMPTILDAFDYSWRWRSAGGERLAGLGGFAGLNYGMFFDMSI